VKAEINTYLHTCIYVAEEVNNDQLILFGRTLGVQHLKKLAKAVLKRSWSSVDIKKAQVPYYQRYLK